MNRKIGAMAVAVALVAAAGTQAMACNCKNKGGKGEGNKISAPAKSDALSQSLIKPYLAIRAALADDKLDQVSANISAIDKAVKAGLADAKKSKKPSSYTESLNALQKSIKGFAGKEKDLKAARDAFGGLSEAFVEYVRGNVSTADAAKYQLFYCDMAKRNWVQKAGEKTGNPYYGKSMAECGEKQAMAGKCGKADCNGKGCQGSACGVSNEDHSTHMHKKGM